MIENPVCCLPGDSVGQAARLMRRERIGPVPVVSNEQTREIIGLITDRDLATKVVAESRDANRTMVADVMTRTIEVCREDDDLGSAIAAMEEYQLRSIPVIDHRGRLVGIISQADVSTRFCEAAATARLFEGISQPARAA
jgi:CBS domain-containing protein